MNNKRYLIATIIVISLAVLVNTFIITQSCLNGFYSSRSSGTVVNLFKAIINSFKKDTINDTNIETFTLVIRKLIGHFGLFVISGIASSSALHMSSRYLKNYKHYMGIIFSLSFGLFMSGLTELIQSFIPDRSGQIVDVLIDFGGYILGLGLVILIVFIIIKKKNKEIE